MKKYEIEDLINSNSDIKKAYEIFRKKYPKNEIIDMYEINHFVKPIIEIYIKYYDFKHHICKFEYYEEL